MALPAPYLDDRRFQDLVDDAKRLVQQRCPEWTDHNVSDPGVTLIETFATMVDQMLYRLNRVPDRNYIHFLDLIGVRLFPPTAARADITFWLSAPQPESVRVPAETQVGTVRTEAEESIVFSTINDLDIIPCERSLVLTQYTGGQTYDRTQPLEMGDQFSCFSDTPTPGDALLIGLSEAVPSCAVSLRFDCRVEGVGIDPRNPPLAWEAWDGAGWAACALERDDTGGFNRPGEVVLHLPATHSTSLIQRQRAGWVRCRLVEAEEDQPTYSQSPKVRQLTAQTVGGTTDAVHAEILKDEDLGLTEGVPGQRFRLRRRPVVPAEEPLVLDIAEGDGWNEWRQVSTFAGSGPDDRHFMLDASAGEIQLGPAVRERDGQLRQYGAVPPKGSTVRARTYRSGGGQRGNVSKGAVRVLKSSVPFIAQVENRRPGAGGVDGESVENAKARGPLLLRTRDRAVTAEDYEQLAREAAPEVSRVRCVSADEADPGAVRILVVPTVADDELGRLGFEQLVPADETLQAIAGYLDSRRTIGARVTVEPPLYQGITVVARLLARTRANPERLRRQALEALYRYFHPVTGGPDGAGWPFGRPVQAGDVFATLQRLTGTEIVEDVRLFAADPITGSRGDAVQRVELARNALAFSFEHQVRVSAQ